MLEIPIIEWKISFPFSWDKHVCPVSILYLNWLPLFPTWTCTTWTERGKQNERLSDLNVKHSSQVKKIFQFIIALLFWGRPFDSNRFVNFYRISRNLEIRWPKSFWFRDRYRFQTSLEFLRSEFSGNRNSLEMDKKCIRQKSKPGKSLFLAAVLRWKCWKNQQIGTEL